MNFEKIKKKMLKNMIFDHIFRSVPRKLQICFSSNFGDVKHQGSAKIQIWRKAKH